MRNIEAARSGFFLDGQSLAIKCFGVRKITTLVSHNTKIMETRGDSKTARSESLPDPQCLALVLFVLGKISPSQRHIAKVVERRCELQALRRQLFLDLH